MTSNSNSFQPLGVGSEAKNLLILCKGAYFLKKKKSPTCFFVCVLRRIFEGSGCVFRHALKQNTRLFSSDPLHKGGGWVVQLPFFLLIIVPAYISCITTIPLLVQPQSDNKLFLFFGKQTQLVRPQFLLDKGRFYIP